MNRSINTIKSQKLGKNMQVIAYGDAKAYPVIAFPTQDQMADEWENNGMIDVFAEYIDAGRVQLFTVDSNDLESWSSTSTDFAARAQRQGQGHDQQHQPHMVLLRRRLRGGSASSSRGNLTGISAKGAVAGGFRKNPFLLLLLPVPPLLFPLHGVLLLRILLLLPQKFLLGLLLHGLLLIVQLLLIIGILRIRGPPGSRVPRRRMEGRAVGGQGLHLLCGAVNPLRRLRIPVTASGSGCAFCHSASLLSPFLFQAEPSAPGSLLSCPFQKTAQSFRYSVSSFSGAG